MVRPPDFEQFLKVLTRRGRPTHLPFYEHLASGGFIRDRLGVDLGQVTGRQHWQLYIDFWLGMGFDCVPLEIPPKLRLGTGGGQGLSHESEAHAVIRTRAEFEAYEWPDLASPIDFEPFEIVGELLPEGAKIVGGVCAGPYEWVSQMMGVMGLSYALADDPDLVAAMFDRIRQIHSSAVRQLATMDAIGALRQGDDLGFKTATFLPPQRLRDWVFPIYRDLASAAHGQGKPFILHSCGNLAEVYEDIIDCGVDAKHSFEDVIQPVQEFKSQYGDRITPLGGLDVDLLCRGTKSEIRAYTRRVVEACFADGHYALGTGNSLTNYLPVEHYLIALDEGRKVAA
ncbi:MAG: uroporphyrinogen decarboxylase family protein [Gemmatimonadota bacterium]